MELYKQTVEPRTFEILQILMNLPSLKSFYLVGGTALSLQWGHRISEDIDMFRFSNEELDHDLIYDDLQQHFTDITELGRQNYYLKLSIENVKIDLLRYKHPLIAEPFVTENIRIVSLKDIAAMKLMAINNRGAKKDFYDFYFLLQLFSLNDIFDFYGQKFGQFDAFQLQKSLCYFQDADVQFQKLEPLSTLTWEEAKNEIKRIAKCI